MRAVTRIGEAWLLACAAAALVLCALSVLGIPWSLPALLIGLAIVSLPLLRLLPSALSKLEWPRLQWSNLIDLFTLALIGGYVRLATVVQPPETDYLTIWGLKGKEFWLHRGIDWHFLATVQNPNTHPDYPILVPLVYDAQALLGGAWPERMAGAVTAAFGIAALLVIRGLLADELPKPGRAIATAMLMPLVFSPFIGLAEGPLIAYALAGLLFIRRGNVTRGAVYLGLCASCKHDGLALIAAVVVAMALSRAWRLIPRLWPAFVIPLPWIVLVRIHGIAATHAQGGMWERVAARIADPAPLFRALLAHPPGRLLFWLGVAAACAIGWRRLVTTERFLAIVAIVQPLFFICVYLGSAYDVSWIVQYSWERILRQTMPVMALAALFCVTPFVIAFQHASEPRTDR